MAVTLARLGGAVYRTSRLSPFPCHPLGRDLSLFFVRTSAAFSPCPPGLPPPPSSCHYHHRRRNRRHFPHRGPFTQLSPSSDEFGRPTAQPPQPRDHPSESLDGFLAIVSSYRPSGRSAVDERTDRHTVVLFSSNARHNFVADYETGGSWAADDAVYPRKDSLEFFSSRRIFL